MNIKLKKAVHNGTAVEYRCDAKDVFVIPHGHDGVSVQAKDGFETEAVVMLGETTVNRIVREKLRSMTAAQLLRFLLETQKEE
jgi:hypothetical protein